MTDNKTIGIIDQPHDDYEKNPLGIDKHAKALTDFISGCDTPLTIGIQGEWGSGKTSLLRQIENQLDGKHRDYTENKDKFLQIWINAWEHSLLSNPEESLLKIVNQIIKNMLNQSALPNKEKTEINNTFKSLVKGAARVAASAAGGKEGVDLFNEISGQDDSVIARLKSRLKVTAEKIVNSGTTDKIVIYVDDLDRINPVNAVEILELLKNIFDVKNCIFVLAIDYQVVIKGLEGKFGKKTDENEWEFRAFFDKIIQLPFMMPLGQYELGSYVKGLLEDIDYIDIDSKTKLPFKKVIENLKTNKKKEEISINLDEVITSILGNSIGSNPRSIKRLINSLSLIELFTSMEKDEGEGSQKDSWEEDIVDDMLMFAIVCLQIKYPDIYDLLAKHPNFKDWNDDIAFQVTHKKEEIDEELSKTFQQDFEQFIKLEEFNDSWEQALFRVCYIKPRYRRRATDISSLLNYIDKTILVEKNTDQKMQDVIKKTGVTAVSTSDTLQSDNKSSGYQTYFGDFDAWIKGKRQGVKSEKPMIISDTEVEFLRMWYNKFKTEYPDAEFTFSPTGGISGKVNRKKFINFAIWKQKKENIIGMMLSRAEKRKFIRPKIDGLNVNDIRKYNPKMKSYKVPWGYQFFDINGSVKAFNDRERIIFELVNESYESTKNGHNLSISDKKRGQHLQLKNIFVKTDDEENHGEAEPWEKK